MTLVPLLRGGNRSIQIPRLPDQISQTAGEEILPGQPVYKNGDLDLDDPDVVLLAQADDEETVDVLGVAAFGGVAAYTSQGQDIAGSHIAIQYQGPLTLTTEQWDEVTGGSGGLTQGSAYYLSASVAGGLTETAPSGGGQFVVPIGIAISTTTLLVLPGAAIEN